MSESQERVCSQCNGKETNQNQLKSTFGRWFTCQSCLDKSAKVLLEYKLSRKQIYPQIQMIIDGIYLGNEDAAIDKQTIEKYQIRAICACGSYLLTPFKDKKMQGKFQNMQYISYHICDFPDQKISHLFDDNSKWIDQRLNQGRNVLFHCSAGISRSASFVIAYLMKKKDMLYPEASKYVKKKRNCINPNSGFKSQLYDYGKKLYQQKLNLEEENVEERYKKEVQKILYGL